jgi:two-component system, sensor histidine kinase
VSAGGRAWRLWSAALLLAMLAFAGYCADLLRTVARERAEVELRVGWMRSAEALHGLGEAAGLAALRAEIAAHPGGEPLAALLPGPRDSLAGFTAAARRELGALSASLGARWDALKFIALGALMFAGLSLALLVLAQRRRTALELAREDLERAHAALQKAHAAEQEAGELKSRFFAYVSHELRTPMQGVLGMASLLGEPGLSEADRRRHIATLQAAARDLLRMVDGVLDFTRVESGHMSVRVEIFSPRTLLEQVAALLQRGAEEKGLALRCELAADLPERLVGDPLRLRQVVLNLLGNAVKFTERGAVTLRARATAGDGLVRLRVEVQDTGPGIDAEARARLFKPFVRVARPGAMRTHGSGLGLAISRRLVDLLGGRLELESTPGVGSTFWFEVELPPAEPTSRPPAPEVTPGGGAGRVLVAEDDPTGRALLQAVLGRVGYEVHTVSDGRAAVGEARAREYAAVLLDVELPGLDGPEAARLMRAQGVEAAMIALTGHTDPAVHARCKAAGIDVVLTKPVEPDAVRSAVARATAGRGEAVDLTILHGYASADDPDFLPGLIEVFLQEAERDLAALRAATREGDAASAMRLAHRLKGSSASFGAHQLVRRCQAVHTAAERGAPIAEGVAAISEAFARVHAALTAERARLRGG